VSSHPPVEADASARNTLLGKRGEDTMHEAKPTLTQRVFHGMRRGLVIASYLFVVLSLLDIHKSAILAEHQIDLVEFALNFINASACRSTYQGYTLQISAAVTF
jgi:hypothetical protein